MDFIICPTCQGEGRVEDKKCHECQGRGIYKWFGGRLLYWDQNYLPPSVFKQKLFFFKNIVLNVILILFGVFGLICGINLVLNYFLDWPFFIPLLKKNLSLIFLFSLITDSYFYYSYIFFKEIENKILFKSFVKRDIYPTSFSDVQNLSKKIKFDVSKVLSRQSETVISLACKAVLNFKQSKIDPIHLLIGLLEDRDILSVLVRLGIDQNELKVKLAENLTSPDYLSNKKEMVSLRNLFSSSLFKKIIIESCIIAGQKKHSLVTPLDIFEAMFSFPNKVKDIFYDLEIGKNEIVNTSLWIDIYKELGEQEKRFYDLARFKPKKGMDRAYTAIATPFINSFCQDLTAIGARGYLPLCLDRDREMEAIFRAFESGQNGIVLVGNPGVGKTTIINGLARKMVTEDVPHFLQDKRLVSLSLAKLVGGATELGEIEERFNIILAEARRSGNIVFFIKDIHNMVGIKGLKGELDISEILAEAVKNKLVFLLSSSIPGEYQRLIERSALGEALVKIPVLEPEDNTIIQILEANISLTEARQKVYFSYGALSQAVALSRRYLHEKFFPEKAINLLNETAVFVRTHQGTGAIVQGKDVAQLISEKINIPLTKITTKESETLLNLEEKIHQRLVDQDMAVKAVASALRRARVELRDTKRPIVNLLFLGPTGVGKTELAKTVATIYFGDENAMIRLDMSEYQTKESIDRLIGSPDGAFSGYLTEAIRKNPFTLLLLDELEKAHPDILNIFLQVMDDGRLTDAMGRTIDFTNVILIGTSNAGTDFITEEINKNTPIERIEYMLMREKLKDYFRPEFLNRFDNIIVFKPLGMEEIKEITKLMLNSLTKQMEQKGVILKVADEAIEELTEAGFDPVFGARPLKRAIQERVNDALANYLLKGELSRRDVAILEKGGKIKIIKAEK